MRSIAIFLFAVVVLDAIPAAANNVGIFGKSGRDEEQGTCTQCHYSDITHSPGSANDPAPTITVEGLDPAKLVTGASIDIFLTVHSSDSSGGQGAAACPNRCAGFNVAVDTGAGQFVVPNDSPVQVNADRDQMSHIVKSPFDDAGNVKYHLVLTGLTAGEHTFFAAANDVDGANFTGDRVGNEVTTFTVQAGSGGGAEGEGEPAQGCAQASTSLPTLALFALAIVLATSFRNGRKRAAVLAGVVGAGAALFVSTAAHAADAPQKNNMENCPSAVAGAVVAVKDVAGGVELSITGPNADATKQIRERSKLLVGASKATPKVIQHDGKGDGGGRTGRCAVVMVKSTVTVADVEGGATLTVKADTAADVEWLRKETHERLESEVAATAGHGKMSHCPSAIDGASTVVADTKDGITVTITGAGDVAKAIRDKTKELLALAAKPDVALGHDGKGEGGGGFGRCPIVVKDTTLSAADVDGGTKVTIVAKAPQSAADLQKEAHARAVRFAPPAAPAPAPTTPAPAPAPTPKPK